MRVVLDTNVLVSAVIVLKGKPRRIFDRVGSEIKLLTSEFILSELAVVLARKHIQKAYKELVTPRAREDYLVKIRKKGKMVNDMTKLDVVRDEKDNRVLACAVDGEADYLVTGDPHLLELKEYQRIEIVTPEEFLRQLNEK